MKKVLFQLTYSFCSLVIFGQAGNLDPSFGSGGIVIGDHFYATSMVIQNDGRIIVAGSGSGATYQFALARYTTEGVLDASFDTDGIVTTDVGMTSDGARNLAIQPDGKIVVVGSAFISSAWGTAIVRYNADGTLDTSFDGDGISYIDMGNSAGDRESVVIQSDGKIVIGCGSNSNFCLFRILPDGSMDNTFDSDGFVYTDFMGYGSDINSLQLQADGKLVAAGTAVDGTSNIVPALARFNTDGSLDNTFGTGGKVFETPVTAYVTEISSLAITSSGKLVTVGYRQFSPGTASELDFFARVYNADGSLDITFGTLGTVTYDYLLEKNLTTDMEIQADGKIVFSAYNYNVSDETFIAARLNEDGTLDTSFDGDGFVSINANSTLTVDHSSCMAIQDDGKILLGGMTYDGLAGNCMLIRLMNESFVSLEKQTSPNQMNIFPNPTVTGDFTISVPKNLSNATLRIIDLNGRVIQEEDGLNGNRLSVSLSEHEAGIYLVEIHMLDEIYRSKVVKN